MASNELQSSSTQQPLTPDEQNFDYEILDVETRIIVRQRTSEIKTLMHRTAQDTIDIGQKLIDVKERLGHGSFINWLKSEFTWSVSTATRFMQVSEQFKFVNLVNLHIAASALYLLAAPSTPPEVRTEVLERATQGEVITHNLAKAIINQHKKVAKHKLPKTFTIDVPPKTVKSRSSTSAVPFVTQPVEAESITVVEQSENKLPEEKTEAPEHFQLSNRSYDINLVANSSNYPPQDRAELETQSLFEIGKLICIADFEQQDHRWLGEVAEVKESTATNIEVVIRISLKPATGSNDTSAYDRK